METQSYKQGEGGYRDPQNRAKMAEMAKIAKMDKNEGKLQVFVFIIEGIEKWIQIIFMKLDYNFPHLDMNRNKVGCMEGAKGSPIEPPKHRKMAEIERIAKRRKN